MIQQIAVWGVMNGVIYAMLALGFTFMFGVARVINLAQGSLFMVSAYFMYIFVSFLHLNIYLSIALTIFLAGVMGVIIYQVLIRRIEEYHASVVLMTMAVALFLQEIILVIFGGEYLSTEPFVPGSIVVLGIDIRYQYLLTLAVVSLCLIGTGVFLYKTRTGLAIRSVAQDREIANVMGINVERTYLVAMGLGAFLAGSAGALIAPIYTLSPTMGWHPLVMMLAVVVLGGLGDIKGSIIGAFILAFVEATVVFLVPMGSFLKDAVALIIVIVVLLTRPEGLFGIAFEEERL